MDSILERRGVRQLVKFGIVGVASTAIDWAIYLVLTRFFGVFYLAAKVISFIISASNSYALNRKWTFRSHDPKKMIQFTKFFVVAVVGLGLNTLIMYLIVDKLHAHDIIGLVVASAIVMVWNFAINKYWTFKTQDEV